MLIYILSLGFPSKKYPLQGIFGLDQAKAIASIGHRIILVSIDIRSIRRMRKWGLQKIYIVWQKRHCQHSFRKSFTYEFI